METVFYLLVTSLILGLLVTLYYSITGDEYYAPTNKFEFFVTWAIFTGLVHIVVSLCYVIYTYGIFNW